MSEIENYIIRIEGGYLSKLLVEKSARGMRLQTGENDFEEDSVMFDINSAEYLCSFLNNVGIKASIVLRE